MPPINAPSGVGFGDSAVYSAAVLILYSAPPMFEAVLLTVVFNKNPGINVVVLSNIDCSVENVRKLSGISNTSTFNSFTSFGVPSLIIIS